MRKQLSLITFGVSGRWRKNRPTFLASGLGNHPKVETTCHVEVHASHREKKWESPSASLIEKDPEVVLDVDIAAHVGRDFFLDEKIPRHESGQGYVRVVEHSVMWKETAASKILLL